MERKFKLRKCRGCGESILIRGMFGYCEKCKTIKCKRCGKEFRAKQLTPLPLYCSPVCRYADHSESMIGLRGEKNYYWKGGRLKSTEGYIKIYLPEHPHGDIKGYILEHRVIMEKHIGRYLSPSEQVHHRNGIKNDNRIENLKLFSGNPHSEEIKCPHCNKMFYIR